TREFYINDAGNQIEKFGKSLSARYLQQHLGESAVAFPEDGYQGEDIKVRAAEFTHIYGDKFVNTSENERKQALIDFALPKNIENLRRDLAKYRIDYDVWFSESTLHNSGEVQRVVDLLIEKGAAYKAEDGAVMYRSAQYSATYGAANKKRDQDEVKDEVLVRANGIPTYFAADIAYHYNKFATRGFDTCIDVWGADHHGHVARMKGAMDAVGLDGAKLDVILMQLVNLMKDGVPVRMSKRTGKAVTLSDLLEEVPIDSTRFFFNMREAGSAMDFDLDLAAKEDSDNPVYYVQYAHARICSILKALAAEGIVPSDVDTLDLSVLSETPERELIRHISYFPGEIISSAKNYDPARITRYVIELATMYHKFYNSCRVKDAADDLRQARMALCIATKNTLHNALVMLKITVPESM
ncbi:MAG: arginine--tRNA ligase, partial [Oscillospiraceae bacterium]|nr:arginine--tRNA ligase [Oscillospiraceae bacterium]